LKETRLYAFFEAFEANSKGTVKWHLRCFCKQKFTREGGVDYQMTDSEVQKVIKEKLMSLKVPLVF
jgi:SecD/SecF fusion protein